MPPNGRIKKGELDRLARLQTVVTKGRLADLDRVQMMSDLYGRGMTQVELSEHLTKASLDAGGEFVGLDAVQKSISKFRKASA